MKLIIDKENQTVTIVLPLIQERSKSGKMINIASTGGFKNTDETYEYKGKSYVVKANVNAGIMNPDY
ncbi:MAG: hypothetical protein ACE5OZ_23195 [Candidatus Heimdallarchaeota archaeon]